MGLTIDMGAAAQPLVTQQDITILTAAFEEIFPVLRDSLHIIDVDSLSLEAMETLNREQRQKSKPTDVLSFPLFESRDAWEAFQQPEITLGTIIICPAYARAQKTPCIDLLHHGILHILGYDHETDEQMWRETERAILGITTKNGLTINGLPTYS